MDVIEQIEQLMAQSRISPRKRTVASYESVFDVSLIYQIQKNQPASLFHSGLQSSVRPYVYTTESLQDDDYAKVFNSLGREQFHKIGTSLKLRPDFYNEISNSLDISVAYLLIPVKKYFKNGKFYLVLSKNLGKLNSRELEAEIGNFYVYALSEMKSTEPLYYSQRSQVSFAEIQVFTQALCKYLIDLYKLPAYGSASTCYSSILRATSIEIPQKQFIALVKSEYKLAKISYKAMRADSQQESNKKPCAAIPRAVSAKRQQQTAQRLYLEHETKKMKLERRTQEKLHRELYDCTFEPQIYQDSSVASKPSDLGISQYLDKQYQLRKAEKLAQVHKLLVELREEAKFFRLKLSDDFIYEVTISLENAADASAQRLIVNYLVDVFHQKYLELYKAETQSLIKQGKVSKIKTDFEPYDTILLSEQKTSRVDDVYTNLELHRLYKQIIINEELERSKRLSSELEERYQRAYSRARLAKAGMKGGGAIYGYLDSGYNVCTTVSDAAEAVRNVSKGGVVTLYSAAGHVNQ